MTTQQKKATHVLIVLVLVYTAVFLLIPSGQKVLAQVHVRNRLLSYHKPETLSVVTYAKSNHATAVPILMYHGVVVQPDGINTSRKTFISQMEMLYSEGFTTITLAEYDAFRKGELMLPARPIILTFDDGRKDSFYRADAILEALNFKASMFVATARANSKDTFYLSWDELRSLKHSGRWELEAHGRHSHDRIPIDSHGTKGLYLASRLWKGDRLETISEFETRVRLDYLGGNEDLTRELQIYPKYFAVPLNDYGASPDESNYPESFEYNYALTEVLYQLSLTQASLDEAGGLPKTTFYNDAVIDGHQLKRLEVREMSAAQLRAALAVFSPVLVRSQ